MSKFNQAELAALEKRLTDIADKIGKKAVRAAERKAMKKVRQEARDNAPEDSGLLDKNFALLTRVKGDEVIAKVGIRGGARENDSTPWYFRLIELGTKNMKAEPFLLPALENNSQDILDTLVVELKNELDKA